ncbi:tail fiber assembly protein [Idiomarina xiamenensis]|uniref:Tail fiber assembly protein n=1 Tax=Idiomarina xiamenensis 10-D-4 TaxID=740709 RepID=K2KM87_9GAMM|nr:tail fiber assembly protein [Idiomarina xiamenensis]EKE78590.1 tail fiber assembly protein [Idiomarina xiamenensis 10-D-4]
MSIDWDTLKTAEDLQAERDESEALNVRNKRDELIRATDYFMLPDAPDAPAGIAEYRQALRDITEQAGFPHDIEWPSLGVD